VADEAKVTRLPLYHHSRCNKNNDKVVIPVTAHLRLLGPGKCMTPKARSPDRAAHATLRAGLKPCRLHEALLR
jgi:hypothetical protein